MMFFTTFFTVRPATDTFVGFEVVVPAVMPGSILVMPPGTGDMIFFIRFRSGTRSLPVVQATERKFQIVLDVPAAAGLRRCRRLEWAASR
jgi:hypothetical protein